ncbi:type II toxin-antitoxin system HipA family toxin [Pseudodesulfovibrio sp.]|uniref:type II toxin-antitoxin system HipA family toxin n=1 Tax=unclassified Pseudodesulfovibrio TaxID=2661612 RepID=UPI003B002A0A
MASDKTYVFMQIDGEFVPAGLLVVDQDGQGVVSEFAYGRKYLGRKNAVSIDPRQLPLTNEKFKTVGLFRGFRDATPDGWGRHILDRAAEKYGMRPKEFDYLTALDPDTRLGALGFGPAPDGQPVSYYPSWRPEKLHGERLDFERLLKAADKILSFEELSPDERRYVIRGSSGVGGAQPKAVVDFEQRKWIAKFSREYEVLPTCRLELAAMNLASRCGIRIPFCKVIQVKARDVFLVERFDCILAYADRWPFSDPHSLARQRAVQEAEPWRRSLDVSKWANGYRRIHTLSAMTLIGASDMHRGAYGDIARAIRRYGTPNHIQDDLTELFRRMVFNILCNNSDDHLRNHGFLYDSEKKGWRLSPAYDIVPQPRQDEGIGADNYRPASLTLDVGEYGRTASLENALSRCEEFGLSGSAARAIVQDMTAIVRDGWREENRKAGVPDSKFRLLEESYLAALAG